MPTLISKKLSDLQAERESLTRYERQIVQERDAILTSVRGHLDQLDREIVRLGGSPRNQESSVAGILSPRKNDNGSQNVRGRSRKEAEVPSSEKIADASSSSTNTNSRFRIQDGKENCPSGNKKRSKSSSIVNENKAIGEAWTCECGTHMAAGRARCGACRRWKGGKRLTRWTINKDSSSTSNNVVRGITENGSSSSICGTSKVFNAYRNLPPAEQKSVSDGSALLTIMSDMVSAIEFVSLAISKTSGNKGVDSMKEDGVLDKRKRGRPSINQVVSTSDSDDGSATKPPRKRGRPRKEQLPMSGLDAQHVESSFAAVETETFATNISPPGMTSSKLQEVAGQSI